jgi:hypothetical protein
VKLLILAGVIGLVALLPFVVIRRPWALRIWRRIKFIVVAYAIVVLVLGIYRLAVNWDAIYG